MLDLIQNIILFIFIVAYVKLRIRIFFIHKALHDLMDLIKQKWEVEAQFGQKFMDRYVDDSLKEFFRKEDDK